MPRFFQPIFTRELLESAHILGMGLALQNPVRARLVLKMKTAKAADDLAQGMRDEPQRWLRLQDSELLLYAQPPEVTVTGTDVELRFNVPENSARLLLQRVAKSNPAPTVVEK